MFSPIGDLELNQKKIRVYLMSKLYMRKEFGIQIKIGTKPLQIIIKELSIIIGTALSMINTILKLIKNLLMLLKLNQQVKVDINITHIVVLLVIIAFRKIFRN
jgi:hypothetical protein